jgi:hypothetical protein
MYLAYYVHFAYGVAKGGRMDELEHLRDFLADYHGEQVVDVRVLAARYHAWASERPKLTDRVLIKRLVALGGYKRRSNGRTVIDITGLV